MFVNVTVHLNDKERVCEKEKKTIDLLKEI
jgi:hypothetical protein